MKSDLKAKAANLSALLDGELDAQETRQTVRAAVEDVELRETWDVYALIGDQLRGEASGRHDLVARVMDQVRDGPVILAPRTNLLPSRNHPVLALAASIAGIAVVGWLALAGGPATTLLDSRHVAALAPATVEAVAMRTPASEAPPAQGVDASPLSGEMGEYLMAHSTQAAPFRLSDGTPQVRTVSLIGRAARP